MLCSHVFHVEFIPQRQTKTRSYVYADVSKPAMRIIPVYKSMGIIFYYSRYKPDNNIYEATNNRLVMYNSTDYMYSLKIPFIKFEYVYKCNSIYDACMRTKLYKVLRMARYQRKINLTCYYTRTKYFLSCTMPITKCIYLSFRNDDLPRETRHWSTPTYRQVNDSSHPLLRYGYHNLYPRLMEWTALMEAQNECQYRKTLRPRLYAENLCDATPAYVDHSNRQTMTIYDAELPHNTMSLAIGQHSVTCMTSFGLTVYIDAQYDIITSEYVCLFLLNQRLYVYKDVSYDKFANIYVNIYHPSEDLYVTAHQHTDMSSVSWLCGLCQRELYSCSATPSVYYYFRCGIDDGIVYGLCQHEQDLRGAALSTLLHYYCSNKQITDRHCMGSYLTDLSGTQLPPHVRPIRYRYGDYYQARERSYAIRIDFFTLTEPTQSYVLCIGHCTVRNNPSTNTLLCFISLLFRCDVWLQESRRMGSRTLYIPICYCRTTPYIEYTNSTRHLGWPTLMEADFVYCQSKEVTSEQCPGTQCGATHASPIHHKRQSITSNYCNFADSGILSSIMIYGNTCIKPHVLVLSNFRHYEFFVNIYLVGYFLVLCVVLVVFHKVVGYQSPDPSTCKIWCTTMHKSCYYGFCIEYVLNVNNCFEPNEFHQPILNGRYTYN